MAVEGEVVATISKNRMTPFLIFVFFASFILGTVIGSFLNVVALRYNTGRRIDGRSGCFSCGKKLAWYELIPILSYIFLRGRCSACKSRISIQYPLVEFLTGILFLGVFVRFSHLFFVDPVTFFVSFLFFTIVFSFLVVIIVYDLLHTIIPDGMVYAFVFFSFCYRLYFLWTSHFSASEIWNMSAGFLFFAFFGGLWLVSRGRWMGFGDAKLVLGIGFLLGLVSGLSALFLAFWIGAVISLILAGRSRLSQGAKKITMKTEIPFAPYLILGLWLVFFFGINVFHLFG